ncbi:hypothetical protein [Solidesulfovibrio magneticus]|uniref:Uncharacterized protein n=1 Tax=Solidesulfovibrio magneticus (strain ATCC 700980 / DSM 13731 / RS-1) TaxID=573370 RepID=C4XUL0_SOLM1|nr:hypothetical protein [Solidesulfovibrio magneticus]BAH73461.1 hypothetical protein DMR_p1_00450 [Solidesulfovibrio magneticus RS-1]
MSSAILHDALARLDDLDKTLSTLRLLADAYVEDGSGGDHVAEYFRNRQKKSFLRLLSFLAWNVPRRDAHGSISNGA